LPEVPTDCRSTFFLTRKVEITGSRKFLFWNK
jgi:hypothetical protein